MIDGLPVQSDDGGEQDAVVIETDRLVLRELKVTDAAFILALVNDPAWLRFIGDRNVHTFDDARAYIVNGPVASYARHGFGLWRVERKSDPAPIGLCGLLKRDTLDDVDIGFAFLPDFRGQGFAFEAAAACVKHARDVLRLERLVAIASPDNRSSLVLLEKLGLRFEKSVRMKDDDSETVLYACDFPAHD